MLDEELLDFLRASIRSTWALELLLLLRKQVRGAAADELVRTLRGTPALVSTCLDQLSAAGLVAREETGVWRYAPVSDALAALVTKLDAAYAERPVAVVNAIVASPNDRLKNFSDAFRFPKKDT
jgi:DNA-binding IclR family transcriptional regulator